MSNRDARTIIGMSREIKEITAERDRLAAALAEIVNMAPECWEGGDDLAKLAVAFVASLAQGTTSMPGHADDCTCWSG